MKAKLIKIEDSKYDLLVDTNLEVLKDTKLSLKNCQAIERGYDLDELFQKELDELLFTGNLDDESDCKLYKSGMYKGVRIIFELLGDKKYSEYDMKSIFEYGWNQRHYSIVDETELEGIKNRYIQSLQQTEWDVEIVTEEVNIGDKYTPDPKPLLDSEGCLILKRK